MTADDLDFDKGGGLVTVVTQDAVTGAVLMVAHMDREAFEKTVATGEPHIPQVGFEAVRQTVSGSFIMGRTALSKRCAYSAR